MRNFYRILFSALTALLPYGCGITNRRPINGDNWNTNVSLGDTPYKIIGKVTGHSQSSYVFGFGGVSSRALYSSARENMIGSACLKDNQAIIYTNTTQSQSGFPPFFWTHEAVASGILIEFVDKDDNRTDASSGHAPTIPVTDSAAVETSASSRYDDNAAKTPVRYKNTSVVSLERDSIDDSYVIYNSQKTDDYVMISKDGRFGIADNDGHIIAPCKYDD